MDKIFDYLFFILILISYLSSVLPLNQLSIHLTLLNNKVFIMSTIVPIVVLSNCIIKVHYKLLWTSLLLLLSFPVEAACAVLADEEILDEPREVGWANNTPWYMTELISRDTTKELSPDSPENIKRENKNFNKHSLICQYVLNNYKCLCSKVLKLTYWSF